MFGGRSGRHLLRKRRTGGSALRCWRQGGQLGCRTPTPRAPSGAFWPPAARAGAELLLRTIGATSVQQTITSLVLPAATLLQDGTVQQFFLYVVLGEPPEQVAHHI